MKELINKINGPIAIIGANGFIGSTLYEILLRHRADDIIPIYRETDINNLKKAKTVFNLSYDKNGNNVKTLSDYLNICDKEARFIHAGSSYEYGINCDRPEEDSPLPEEPDDFYRNEKIQTTELVLKYAKELDFNACVLRLYSVYGDDDNPASLVPLAISEAKEGNHLQYGDPNASYDFVNVYEVCRAFIRAAITNNPIKGQIFNIGTGECTYLFEFAHMVKNIFNLKGNPQFEKYTAGRKFSDPWRANTKKTEQILHWKAISTLETYLKLHA